MDKSWETAASSNPHCGGFKHCPGETYSKDPKCKECYDDYYMAIGQLRTRLDQAEEYEAEYEAQIANKTW